MGNRKKYVTVDNQGREVKANSKVEGAMRLVIDPAFKEAQGIVGTTSIDKVMGMSRVLSDQAAELTPEAIEERLAMQMMVLEDMFVNLAVNLKSDNAIIMGVDRQLAITKMALSAQNAIRKTAETLHQMKKPRQPATYISRPRKTLN